MQSAKLTRRLAGTSAPIGPHKGSFTARALTQPIKRLIGPAATAWVARRRWSLLCAWASWGRVQKPSDPRWIEVLDDPEFRRSVREVRDTSTLDTVRLANLWQWCGLSEEGAMIEVGAFRGGTALHLSNRWPRRRIFVCDTFEGFWHLQRDAELDAGVPAGSWCNRDREGVRALFAARGRDAVLLEGAFPQSDTRNEVREISFAHIDVDIYASCLTSLDYLAGRATPSALFIVNDYLRSRTAGIKQAVAEFLKDHPGWLVLPVYPAQGVLFNAANHGSSARCAGVPGR